MPEPDPDLARYRKRGKAQVEIEEWLLDYQEASGLTDIDMLVILGKVQATTLACADRDDEERRTGRRRRLVGE